MRLSGTALRLLLTLLVALVSPGGSALADKRVALVIGNADYRNAGVLANPRNDARSVGAALSALGFDVDTGLDLDRDGFVASLRRFGDRMEGATAAVFYYAGHGLQVNGANYLLPTDAKLLKEVHLDYEAVALSTVLRTMEGGGRVNIVFLDACRDNPLGRNLGSGGRSVVGRGLARVDASLGTLISFATAEGRIADDGKGRNSPYTAALVKHLQTPGLELGKVLLRVRQDVLQATNNEQVPWEHSSLTREFYFSPQAPANSAGSTPSTAPAVSSAEIVFWQSIQSSGNASDFQAYLAQFPFGVYAALARNRLAALGPAADAKPSAVASIPERPKPNEPIVKPLNTTMYAAGQTVIRNQPVVGGKTVQTLSSGEAVVVTGEIQDPPFYEVRRSAGGVGYVAKIMLQSSRTESQSAPPASTSSMVRPLNMVMHAKGAVSVRDIPSTYAPVLKSLANGESVTVTGEVIGASWYQINTNAGIGYIQKDGLVRDIPKSDDRKIQDDRQKILNDFEKAKRTLEELSDSVSLRG